MVPELLMPAGSIEKMEYAFAYGADAVYLGMVDFSLRALRKGDLITAENLKSAVDIAHSIGKKVYLTLNIYAFNEDIKKLDATLDVVKNAKPDAILVSDFGILKKIKTRLPQIPFHASTQANTLNGEAVKFWQELGATRVVLARELSIKEISEIKKAVPDMELEVFIHGSQCVSFSGRCLLSDYMTGGERLANHGNCSQPCRWSYKLLEETRPGQYYEIEQTDRGTHILSPKDLMLAKYIPDLIEAGVDSFKVEGRTKSLYYVSAVAKTYRKAIDEYVNHKTLDFEFYKNELLKVGNRGYTTGFFIEKDTPDGYSYDISKGLAGADFLCEFVEEKDGLCKVKTRNKMLLGDEIEIITPDEQFIAKIEKIYSPKNPEEEQDVANTNDELFIKFSQNPKSCKFALGRTVGIKEL